MTVGTIFSNALTALQASQTALNVVSQNVANANTPSYVRAEVNLSTQTTGGVAVQSITRAANRYLAAASHGASAALGAASARADLLERAQGAFGDPNTTNTLFGELNEAFTALQALSVSPTSSLERSNAIAALSRTLSETAGVANEIEALRLEADKRIVEQIEVANTYLKEIAERNIDVSRITVARGDATSAENARDEVIDKLAEILDIRVSPSEAGMVEIRTSSGVLLARAEAATLSYDHDLHPYGEGGVILLNEGKTSEIELQPMLRDGSLKGLIDARDVDLTALGDALGEFAGVLGDALNEVHALNSGAPPPSSVTGRATGLLEGDALNFTGATIIGVANANGELLSRITIDFDADTITVDDASGATTTAVTLETIGDLRDALDPILAAEGGSADFSNGRLELTGGAGLLFGEPETGGSDRGGRGFAHFFGVNDLIESDTPLFFEAGVSGTDAHGVVAGGELVLRVKDASGRVAQELALAPTVGGTWDDLVAQINDPVNGIGRFVTASVADGRLELQNLHGASVEITGDTTQRGDTSVSISALFGLNRSATAGRAEDVRVADAILADHTRLSLGRPSLEVDIGERVVERGDSRGAQALSAAKNAAHSFVAVRGISGGEVSLSHYASSLAGLASNSARSAENARSGAEIVMRAASERRLSAESVSVDDELIKMTQFQQSYSAAARLLQAATEMFDTLLQIA
jgi:flagellar hook-associated protein 1 FlgK